MRGLEAAFVAGHLQFARQFNQSSRDTSTVLEEGTKLTWKIPCVAMQGYTEVERRTEQTPYEPPSEPVSAATKARAFQRGDNGTFDDRDGRAITGVIVRINQRTATIGTGTADGGTWRVSLHMLRHVLDIRASSDSCNCSGQEGLEAVLTLHPGASARRQKLQTTAETSQPAERRTRFRPSSDGRGWTQKPATCFRAQRANRPSPHRGR